MGAVNTKKDRWPD